MDVYVCVCLCVCVLVLQLQVDAAHYTPQWAVHVSGGPDVAQQVAQRNGFVYLGQVQSRSLYTVPLQYWPSLRLPRERLSRNSCTQRFHEPYIPVAARSHLNKAVSFHSLDHYLSFVRLSFYRNKCHC